MGWLDWLSAGRSGLLDDRPDVLRRIADLLDHVEPQYARYLAGFAYLLGRVAHIDDDLSPDELASMVTLVAAEAGIGDAEAGVVVDLAQALSRTERGTEDFRVTQEFRGLATEAQQLGLVRCLFAVAASDESVSLAEDNEIRRITQELGLPHDAFIGARLEVRDRLAVTRPSTKGRRDG